MLSEALLNTLLLGPYGVPLGIKPRRKIDSCGTSVLYASHFVTNSFPFLVSLALKSRRYRTDNFYATALSAGGAQSGRQDKASGVCGVVAGPRRFWLCYSKTESRNNNRGFERTTKEDTTRCQTTASNGPALSQNY
jgi:hypothetical protein